MKRLLALVVAVALVVGAVVLRSRLDSSGGSGADVAAGGSGGAAGALRLGCIEELRAVCEALDAADDDLTVVIEPAGSTMRTLTAPDASAPIDGWLTFAPLVGVVAIERQQKLLDPILGQPEAVLARSPLGISIWPERADALTATCGELTWRCLGERAGERWSALGGQETWGTLRVTNPSPVDSGAGLLTVGHIGVSYFGGASFSTNDIRGDAGFGAFFDRVEQLVPTTSSPFEDQLRFERAKFDAVGVVTAQAEPVIARSRYRDGGLRLVVPQPAAFAEVVLVPVLGAPGAAGAARARDDVVDALVDAGWDAVDGAAGAPGPASSGLPADGVLIALRTLFEEVIR